MEEEQTRPRAAERVTQGTPQVTTITRVLRVEMQMIMMVAINGRHLTNRKEGLLRNLSSDSPQVTFPSTPTLAPHPNKWSTVEGRWRSNIQIFVNAY